MSTGRDLVGRITAKVMVQGRGPYDFVVDTGANRTVVSTELADELRLPDAGMARVHGIVGAENTRTVVVDALRIDAMAARFTIHMSEGAMARETVTFKLPRILAD